MTIVAPIPRGLSLATASVILLLTLALQLTYVDHLVASLAPPAAPHSAPHTHNADTSNHAADEDAARTHALHCHDGPGSCSELPMSAGPGQLLVGEMLLPGAVMATLLLAFMLNDRRLPGTTVRPSLQPPQLSIA